MMAHLDHQVKRCEQCEELYCVNGATERKDAPRDPQRFCDRDCEESYDEGADDSVTLVPYGEQWVSL